tara:strand:+ start:171 stop:575 length:405 start_codon:yes stop_codon:yes gene_type:complete
MERSAHEIIRELELRVARLESETTTNATSKIRSAWSKLEPKIHKHYLVAKENAKKVSREIDLGSPRLSIADKTVYYKTKEPRELRHPDEYGDYAYEMLDSKEYKNYKKSQNEIADLIESFCQKFGLDFVWAGSW